MYHDEAAVLNRTATTHIEDEIPFFIPNSEKPVSWHRCLVVDDDPTILRLVGEMLTELDYHVDMAADGAQALLALSSNHYDLVLSDLDMPILSGYHLALSVKKKNRNIKVVIMTGHCQHELADMMGAGPVDAWLFKPFAMSALSKVLDSLELPTSAWHTVSSTAMQL